MKVLTEATAQRIIFKEGPIVADSSGNYVIQAEGVEFKHGGAVHIVRAKREVVLTAGYALESFDYSLRGLNMI